MNSIHSIDVSMTRLLTQFLNSHANEMVIGDTNQRTMNESLGFLAHEIRNLIGKQQTGFFVITSLHFFMAETNET